MACTARWSSITLSLGAPIAIPGAPEGTNAPPANADNGNVFRSGGARFGGLWYASPGCAPPAVLRKNASQLLKIIWGKL